MGLITLLSILAIVLIALVVMVVTILFVRLLRFIESKGFIITPTPTSKQDIDRRNWNQKALIISITILWPISGLISKLVIGDWKYGATIGASAGLIIGILLGLANQFEGFRRFRNTSPLYRYVENAALILLGISLVIMVYLFIDEAIRGF